jgi:hypothetical protein
VKGSNGPFVSVTTPLAWQRRNGGYRGILRLAELRLLQTSPADVDGVHSHRVLQPILAPQNDV